MLSLEIEQFILIKRVNKEFYKFGHSSLVGNILLCSKNIVALALLSRVESSMYVCFNSKTRT